MITVALHKGHSSCDRCGDAVVTECTVRLSSPGGIYQPPIEDATVTIEGTVCKDCYKELVNTYEHDPSNTSQ